MPQFRWRSAALLILGVILAGSLIVAVIWVLPSLLTRRPKVSGADRLTAINGARTALVTLVAALGALGGLAYTIRTYRLGRRGQIADRFTKSVDQLSSDNANVRIGGLYALQRIASEEPVQYRDTIIEVVAAYIRDVTPWPIGEAAPMPRFRRFRQSSPVHVPTPGLDARVALVVVLQLCRAEKRKRLDLSRTNLFGQDLTKALLVDALLMNSNLEKAKFNGADMKGADLRGALLQNTHFARTDLAEAMISPNVDAAMFRHAKVRPPSS